jgi:hypothetical protein
MFAAAGVQSLTLYRGYALTGAWQPDRPASLVSATADKAVALAHFDAGTAAGLLQRAVVGVDRVLMTWPETPRLSRPYRESEVVLMTADPATTSF